MILSLCYTLVLGGRCCDKKFSIFEQLIADYIKNGLDYINKQIDKFYADEIYGKNEEKDVDAINDFYYLLMYLLEIQYEMNNDSKQNVIHPASYYFNEYKLQCIIDYFNCRNLDIEPLLNVFGLSHSTINDNTGGCPGVGQEQVNVTTFTCAD